jgi:transposase-like protein
MKKERKKSMRKKASGKLMEALEELIENQEDIDGLKDINEVLINALMAKERDVFLKNNANNKANGYYDRTLSCGLGKLDLTIPHDRLGEFRPFLLPKQWHRGEQTYEDLTASLIIHAYSPNKIKAILNNLGLPYSKNDIDELKESLYQKSMEFKTRELDTDVFCIYIDAYHTKIKDDDSNKVKKAAIYTVIGIDLDGNKEVYGYYEFFGSEKKEFWLSVFNDLISRGLTRPLLIVSDDFPGLSKAIETLYPKTDHQLCFVHMMRNVRRHMSRQDAKFFNDSIKHIRTLRDFDKAISEFDKLCSNYIKKYKYFIDILLSKKDNYFVFLKYPYGVRKHIYTTNPSENINSRLEVLRVNLGGYFQSPKTLNIAIQVLIDKIKINRWSKPMPAFREFQYEIHQMFNQKFASDNLAQTQFS